MFKSLKKFIIETINYNFCPFCVYSVEFNKTHYSWSMRCAQEWMDCYPETFGRVMLLGFNRDIIEIKGA